MLLFTLSFILVSTFFLFATALLVFLREPRNRLHGSFFLYFFSLTTWSFGVFGMVSGVEGHGLFWLYMLSGGMIFLPSTFQLFLYNFLSTAFRPRRGLVLGAVFISIVYFVFTFTPYMYRDIETTGFGSKGIVRDLWYTFFLYFTFSLFYGEYLIYKELAGSEGRRFRQLMYAFLGHLFFLLGIYLSIPTMLGEAVFGGFPFWSLSSVVYGFLLVTALLKRNLPDLRFGIRFLASRMILIAVFGGIYLIINWIIEIEAPGAGFWPVIVTGLVIIYLTGEFYGIFKESIDHILSLYLGLERIKRSPLKMKEKGQTSSPWSHGVDLLSIQTDLKNALEARGIVLDPDIKLPGVISGADFISAVEENRNALKQIFQQDLVGVSGDFYHVLQNVLDFAHLNRPIVLEGDPGTGKKTLARAIHHLRGGGELLQVSCRDEKLPAIRGTVKRFLEYSDESKKAPGLMLSDVEYVKPELARIISPLFDSFYGERHVYFTTLNTDFARLDSHARFFSGLNEIVIRIPSLQSRPIDIFVLALMNLIKTCIPDTLQGVTIERRFIKKILDYPWAGNVQELEQIIKDAVFNNPDGIFQDIDLSSSDEVRSTERLSPLEESEKRVITQYLHKNNFNKNRTRLDLNITINTLNSKIQKYGILVEE